MSPFSNTISCFLLLTTLLLPSQTIARDSQFFSKVTHFNNKETQFPNKEESPLTKQPPFIPETQSSYGLYGQDSDQLPSTEAATTTAAVTDSYFQDNNNNNKYYNNDAYNTKFTEEGYNSMMEKQNNYNNVGNEITFDNNKNKNYNNNYNVESNNYNGEKQGMSDTRFLEGGKYYYDVNYEKYNPTMYGDSSRGMNNNNYGYYHNKGNSYNSNYGNNNEYQNNHGNYNGYQNHEEFEDQQHEFDVEP